MKVFTYIKNHVWKKMQSGLFKFRFSPTINHQKTTVNIGGFRPHFTKKEAGMCHCDKCSKKFKSNQGLISHSTGAYPKTTSSQHDESTINLVFIGPIRESSVKSDVRPSIQASAYEACDHTSMPLHMPKTLETRKKSTPCLIKKASRCATDYTSKTTMFFIFQFQ